MCGLSRQVVVGILKWCSCTTSYYQVLRTNEKKNPADKLKLEMVRSKVNTKMKLILADCHAINTDTKHYPCLKN